MPHSDITTVITEFLDQEGIKYRLLLHAKAVVTCEEAAEERGVPLGEMIKCLVFKDKVTADVYLACVPADRRVSMPNLKKFFRKDSFSVPAPEEIKEHTGFETGSIPPVNLPADVNLVADQTILKKKKVNISSGSPLAGIELSTWDFRKLFKGRFAKIAE